MAILLYLLVTPLLIMLLARKWKWIDTVSPMTLLYAIGLCVGNFVNIPKEALDINSAVTAAAIPVAIPLMLTGCGTGKWSTGKAAKVFLSGLLAVIIVVVAGFFLFRGSCGSEDFAKVAAVALGMYTGGMPNVGAIAQGVGMGGELYLYVTSYDLVITGSYLLFVILLGKPLFRWLLPPTSPAKDSHPETPTATTAPAKRPWCDLAIAILLSLAITATAYLLSTLATPDGTPNMTVLILALTTLAIAASFLPPVRRQTRTFDIGLYCVYVFCLSLATACNVREMDFLGSLSILAFIAFVVFGSLVLQILFAKLLHIDGDSVLASSVALINSPPFVPMVAAILDNRNIIVLGITVGLLGYIFGNYLGIGLYQLLCLFV